MERSKQHDCCLLRIVTVCISLVAIVGCESVPVRPMNPDPRAEYEQAQKEYNDALAYRAQVQANQRINAMNERLGTFQGSRTSQGVGLLLGASADLGEVDAQQKVDAAYQRLQAAQHRLDQHIYIHKGQ